MRQLFVIPRRKLRWIALGGIPLTFFVVLVRYAALLCHVDTSMTKQTVQQDSAESVISGEVAEKVRLLCLVKTSPLTHRSKADHVQATWGRRCDKLFFATEQNDSALHEVLLVNVTTERKTISFKVVGAFEYIYQHYFDTADWFLEADDDTYIIVENLKYFLSKQDTESPFYFGQPLHAFTPLAEFPSGGSGYVLGREALRRFGNRKPGECGSPENLNDDHYMGMCMETLGVKFGDSRDEHGRSRFHCFQPSMHLKGNYPPWYSEYNTYGAKKGMLNISREAISFHYVTADLMHEMELLLYHIRPVKILRSTADCLTSQVSQRTLYCLIVFTNFRKIFNLR